MRRDQGGGARSNSPKKIFAGVRFVLFGFDSVSEAQYRFELVNRGGFDVGRYDSSCTHVIVSGRVFDEPVCVAARNDGKMLITELWIDDSLSFGMLADYTKVLYRPVRDLSGIPGSESLNICLTGYQRQERDDIMRMVSLMGGHFSKPLIANQVTHLVCYKFEGEKYELAKKVNIKLVNHRWLEDCLKAWDILPIDNYGQSGLELELLEAAAMDTDDEAVDAGNRVTVQRSITESHSLRGEISVNIGSDTLVDKISLGLKKNALSAKPGDLSVNSLLISTPHKVNSSRKAIDICGIEDKAPNLNHHLECRVAEKLSDNFDSAMINSKSKDTNLLDSNSKCNHLSSNVRNSLMNETSCEKDIKSSSPSYLRKITEKAVALEAVPHIGPPEDLNIAGEARASYAESKDAATKACMYDSLQNSTSCLNKPHVDRNTQSLPKKRKLSGSKLSSKLIKIGQASSNSLLLDASKSVSSEELNFPKPQQQEPKSFTQNESSMNICHMVEINDAFPQTEMLSISNTCLRSPLLAQKDSGNCVKQNPSTSTSLGQIKSVNAHHHEIEHDLADSNGFEVTVFAQPRESEPGTLPKSGSLKYKRKFLKNWQPASSVNISSSSSSMPDNKDELLNVPSNSTLDETASPTHKPVSGVGTLYDIPFSKAMVLSDCSLNNEPEKTEDRRMGNDLRILRPPSAGSGNANEETIGVKLFETSLKSMVKSGSAAKSQNVDGISMKYNTDICNEASEHQENPGEDQEDFPFELKGTKVKGSISTEINGFCENGKDNKGSLLNNQKGRRPKKCRENCKNKHSSDSLKSINLTKSAIKSGNGVVKLGNIDSLKENIEKEYLPMKEKGEVEQCHSLASNTIIDVLDENHLDPEKENKLMDSCNLIIKEDEDCGYMVKKICKSDLGIKCSRNDNIVSIPKLTDMGTVIPSPTAWFLLSGHRSQRVEFQKIIKRLRGKLCKDSHNWAYEATHFIVPDYVRRTQKFFAAVAAGRWILRSDYLTASNEAGKFLIEEPFEWHKNGLSEDGAISLEAPRKWRTLRERTGHGAFYKMRIIIYGECIAPSLDTLKRVVKAGDGTILATSPPYTRFLNSGIDYAIVSASMPPIDKWVQELLRHEIPCVLPEYLVEYVCKPGYSLEKHVLYRTHTWATKSFENMVIRSSEVDYDQPSIGDSFVSLKCVVCGSPDREELMLICGDDDGARGCGVGTHIDCCDPPLSAVPEGDWFCSNCSRNMGQKKILAKSTKAKRKKSNY